MSKREPQSCSTCTSQRVCIGTKKCAVWDSFARASVTEPLRKWKRYRSTLPALEAREPCQDCESAPALRERLCGKCWLHRWREERAA